jgi:hypothetical protein
MEIRSLALGRTLGETAILQGTPESLALRLKYFWCSGFGTRGVEVLKGTPWEMTHFLFNSLSIQFSGPSLVIPTCMEDLHFLEYIYKKIQVIYLV